MTVAAIDEELAGRANLCRLLAQLYRRGLTPEAVAELERRGLLAPLAQGSYLPQRERLGDPEFLQALALEHTRIFLGPGPHVSPYGSVHHPDDAKAGRLWGDTSTWVRQFIQDHGLSFEGEAYDGIPDHVSHELEFYGRLLDAELTARQGGDRGATERLVNSQALFLGRHLERWLPRFCDRVRAADRLGFYKELARLTEDFLTLEHERLVP